MNRTLALMLPALLWATSVKADVLYFGPGIAYYDNDIVHYNDKTYRDSFSWDLGLYSDFDQSHMVFLDAHLYAPIINPVASFQTFAYAGIGGLYLRNTNNYVQEKAPDQYEGNWGIRFPVGIEAIHDSNLSVFAEVIPTFIVDPDTEYETVFTFGMRYYLPIQW